MRIDQRYSASLAVCLAMVLANSAAPGGPVMDRASLIQGLRERETRISDFAGSYEWHQTASDEFADMVARAKKGNRRETLDHFEARGINKFAAKLSNGIMRERMLEQKTLNMAGEKQLHSLIAFDGAKRYDISNIPEPDDRFVAMVTLGRVVAPRFDSECDAAILLGFSLPDCDGPLSACAQTYGGTVSGPVSVDGTTGVDLHLTRPERDGKPAAHITVRLDPDRGLVVRSIAIEMVVPDAPQPPGFRWDVEELKKDPATGLWYPIRAKYQMVGPGGPELIRDLVLSDLRFNSGLTSAAFTPAIEDGSNVYDEEAKTGYVAGGRLSPRIKAFLKDSAEAARREIAEVNAGPTLQVPPVKSGWYGWLLVIAGMALIAIAVGWRWRRGRSPA